MPITTRRRRVTAARRRARPTHRPRNLPGVFEFEATLWEWKNNPAWVFLTVPEDVTELIAAQSATQPRRGFGSVRVKVTIGTTTWKTSVFPQTEDNYVLPIKKAVRTKESLVGRRHRAGRPRTHRLNGSARRLSYSTPAGCDPVSKSPDSRRSEAD